MLEGKHAAYYYIDRQVGSCGNRHVLYTHLLSAGGVHATYYSSATAAAAASSSSFATVLPAPAILTSNDKKFFSVLGMDKAVKHSHDLDAGLGANASFVVRWFGMIGLEPEVEKQGTPLSRKYQWVGMAPGDRVRVWVDNSLVIDQWTSLSSHEPTAVIKYPMQSRKYDIQVEWMRGSTTIASSSPQLLECPAPSAWINCPACELVYDCSTRVCHLGNHTPAGTCEGAGTCACDAAGQQVLKSPV